MWFSHFPYIHYVNFWYTCMCIWWPQRYSFFWRNFMSIWYCAKFEEQFWANWHRQKYRKPSMRLAPAFNKWILQQLCRCLDYAFAVCPHRFISTVVVAEGQGNTTGHCITLLPVDRSRQKLWINSATGDGDTLHHGTKLCIKILSELKYADTYYLCDHIVPITSLYLLILLKVTFLLSACII